MSVYKNGGDSSNVGVQTADSNAENTNVAAGGDGVVGSYGGDAMAQGIAESAVNQALLQAGFGGDAGDDNINSTTSINIG